MKTTYTAMAVKRVLNYTGPVSRVFLFCMGVAILLACDKTLDAPELMPLETGQLSADKNTVVIDGSKPSMQALTLSWTATPNSLIAYKIVLTAGTVNDTLDAPLNKVAKAFSNTELNDILLDKFSMKIGVEGTVEAEIIALIATNGKTAKSNRVQIKVTPVRKAPAFIEMWIVGDATPNGWNIDGPNKMMKDPTNEFQFKYNDILNAGEFKIPTTTKNWNCDFFMPPNNNPPLTSTDVKLVPGGNPDNKWRIAESGAYKILLNISSTPSIKIIPFTPFKALWLMGNTVLAGSNTGNQAPMVATKQNSYEFTYTGLLGVGMFNISTATENLDGNYFMPPADGAPITESNAISSPKGKSDNKWKITEAGTYKITLNQLYETISIVKQ